MSLKASRRVRASEVVSIFEKRFRNPITGKIAKQLPVLPQFVLMDLRRGSLRGLELYLSKHGSIVDERIAKELRTLISGSSPNKEYRLALIPHPDARRKTGGRPKSQKKAQRDLEIARRYRELIAIEGKKYLVVERLALEFEVSVKTIERAIDKSPDVEDAEVVVQRRFRRKMALKKLADQSSPTCKEGQ